jgi:hypothetical protein
MSDTPWNTPRLFAHAHGQEIRGPARCHWCGNPCDRLWPHDDLPPLPFTKQKYHALCPSEPWVCVGCWLYRRKRVTLRFFSGDFRDGQAAGDHSWLLTEGGFWGLSPYCLKSPQLREFFLKPPLRWALAVRDGREPPACLIHRTPLNDLPEVQVGSLLRFTINNVEHTYSVFELSQAMAHGTPGKQAGTRELFRLLGEPRLKPPLPPPPPSVGGRPKEPEPAAAVLTRNVQTPPNQGPAPNPARKLLSKATSG